MLQDVFHVFSIKHLNGAFEQKEKPVMNYENWWLGKFQDAFTDYTNQNMEFRPSLVRINNQIDFSLFRKSNASKVVIGKENYLYEDNYIDAYLGTDYLGLSNIEDKVNTALSVQKMLENQGTMLLFVFLPGKASFFPEFIPEHLLKKKCDSTNYQYLLKTCSEKGLNYIDFNDWFIQMKDTVSYPLYPKCGIHWSYYGMFLAADSLVHYLENMLQSDLPDLELLSIENTSEQKGTDYDIGNTLNLQFPINTYQMAYPSFGYHSDGKLKPKVLVVGDSYYWNIYYSGIPANVFEKLEFWYYNYNVHADGTDKVIATTDAIDYYASISAQDVIIVMQTDGGLNNFGLGFFEKAQASLMSSTWENRINYYTELILADPEWKAHIQEKAKEQGISFDEMLSKDALYMVQQEEINN